MEPQWYVYLFQNALARELKVGISTDPARRMCSVGHLVDPEQSWYCACPYALRLESEIKARFHAFRVPKRPGLDGSTEWFSQDCKGEIMQILSWIGTPLIPLSTGVQKRRRKVLSIAQEKAIFRARLKAVSDRQAAIDRIDRRDERRNNAIRRGWRLFCQKNGIVRIESAQRTIIVAPAWTRTEEERFDHKLPYVMRLYTSAKLGYGVVVIRESVGSALDSGVDALQSGIDCVPLIGKEKREEWNEIKRLVDAIQGDPDGQIE